MKILINDFSGHAFQVQLSRELAKRGHEVLHTWCSSFLTPHGMLVKQDSDPPNFAVKPVSLGHNINKYGLLSRWLQEREVGRRTVAVAADFAPQVIISANTPLGAQGMLLSYARCHRVPFIFWLQDLYGVGTTANLRKRIPVFGVVLGRAFGLYEQHLLRCSAHVIAITKDFLPFLPEKVRNSTTTVIENWAPLDELPVQPKGNEWSRAHGLADKIVFLYAGTLGMKHNPSLLLELAGSIRHRPNVRVVVISEGAGAEFLKQQALGLDNLVVMGFQPFERMPEVHASADVLVAILEQDAGVFAVPSKVLSYLCAKRSLLLAVPSANLAAHTVKQADAGLTVEPDDVNGFVAAAGRLADEPDLRARFAANGRRYAEQTFDIMRIADKFEGIMKTLVRHQSEACADENLPS